MDGEKCHHMCVTLHKTMLLAAVLVCPACCNKIRKANRKIISRFTRAAAKACVVTSACRLGKDVHVAIDRLFFSFEESPINAMIHLLWHMGFQWDWVWVVFSTIYIHLWNNLRFNDKLK